MVLSVRALFLIISIILYLIIESPYDGNYIYTLLKFIVLIINNYIVFIIKWIPYNIIHSYN